MRSKEEEVVDEGVLAGSMTEQRKCSKKRRKQEGSEKSIGSQEQKCNWGRLYVRTKLLTQIR